MLRLTPGFNPTKIFICKVAIISVFVTKLHSNRIIFSCYKVRKLKSKNQKIKGNVVCEDQLQGSFHQHSNGAKAACRLTLNLLTYSAGFEHLF